MTKTLRNIEVFRPGTFQPMAGPAVTLSADDLADVAAIYDRASAPAPAVVGHPKTDSPAYGWAASFSYDVDRERLIASLDDIAPAFADAVAQKSYHKISLSLFRPEAANNPKPGHWYPKHIGFLGGAAPAVPGLAPVSFAGDDEGVATVEFGDPAFRDVGGVFRSLRDFFIEKFGLDEADKALPSWQIGWIEAQDKDDDGAGDQPGFVAPPEPTSPTPPRDLSMTDAKRLADLAARETALNLREAALRATENASFAEALVTDGRLLPVSAPKVVAALNALSLATPVEASFAEGGATVTAPALDLIKDVLKSQPKMVAFGKHTMPPEIATAAAAEFSADGAEVDADGLETLAKVRAYQAAHPGVDYLTACRAVGVK